MEKANIQNTVWGSPGGQLTCTHSKTWCCDGGTGIEVIENLRYLLAIHLTYITKCHLATFI